MVLVANFLQYYWWSNSIFILKEDDPRLAKNCLILGIIITAVGFFVGFFMGLAMAPMMGMYTGF